jgi:glycosyltransferase involved in cell wall biosynthesis
VGVIPFPDEPKFQVSSPLKLFEYMASGLPILATRIVCHTDVIGDGKYVFWAETSEVDKIAAALRFIWLSRDSLEELGKQAVSAAQDWTWHESARKIKVALERGLERYG